jgi:hypothetical protein
MQVNIEHLHLHLPRPCPGRDIEYAFRLGDQTHYFKGRLRMALTLPSLHEVTFVLPTSGLDAAGNTVELATIPTVAVSDPALLEVVQPNPETPDDPASGILRSLGPAGSAQFTLTEDEGEEPITAIVDVSIVAGRLVTLPETVFGPVRESTADATPEPEPPTP